MITSLPERYRPQTFQDLIGQSRIQTTLINAIETQTIAPAYLFHGTRGTGKTTSARIFAKALNCQSSDRPTSKPCQLCESCRRITVSNSLDVSEINAADNNGVDAARELMERSTFAPIASRFKVFILDEAHMLTVQAQNALLTTLEAPPPSVVFILCTTDPQRLLKTILSRCTQFKFNAIKPSDIEHRLTEIAAIESIEATPEAFSAIARIANGGLRDALTLINQLKLSGKITADSVAEAMDALTEAEAIALLQAVQAQNFYPLLTTARSLIDHHKSPTLIVRTLMQTLNDMLILKTSNDAALLRSYTVSAASLKKQIGTWSIDAIYCSLDTLHQAEERLRTSNNSEIWLESCLIALANRLSDRISVESSTTQKSADEVWRSVIQEAGEKGQWLSQAALVRLSSSKAVLRVPNACLSRFEKNREKLLTRLKAASGYPSLKLLIKEQS